LYLTRVSQRLQIILIYTLVIFVHLCVSTPLPNVPHRHKTSSNMSIKYGVLKNVGSSWFGVATTLIVGILLPPLILHRLGDEAFGLWILIFSFTGFYGIFDLGIRSSIVKHVAEFEATGEHDQLNRLVNVSLFVYTCIAVALLVAVGIGSVYVNSVFHISFSLQKTARVLFLMVGSGVALGFPLTVFAGILEGLQKYYLLNITQAVAVVLRALLIVFVLSHGMGILSVALITVTLPLLCYMTYAWRVLHTVPLKFGIRFLSRSTFRKSFDYGLFSFISSVAFRLRFQADAIVIGAMLSASAITYFSIASKLIDYPFLLVGGLIQFIPPISSQYNATGNNNRLRKLFVLGNRACALIVFPISAMLWILGKSVIDVWVGARYESSYVILMVLLVPTVLADIQASSRQVLLGIGRHKVMALVHVGEGVANLILSVILIRYLGVIGVALGTAIPLALTSLFFLPFYSCRILQVPLKEFLREAYLLPCLLCAPLVAALLFTRSLMSAHNLSQLLVQATVGGLVYGIAVVGWFLVREPMGIESRTKLKLFVLQAFSR
jgi:O-antigen/teichoic acid export membrane protein